MGAAFTYTFVDSTAGASRLNRISSAVACYGRTCPTPHPTQVITATNRVTLNTAAVLSIQELVDRSFTTGGIDGLELLNGGAAATARVGGRAGDGVGDGRSWPVG